MSTYFCSIGRLIAASVFVGATACGSDAVNHATHQDLVVGGRPAEPNGLHPRNPDEWQGMLVHVDFMALCGAIDSCGLAMACISGTCGPCTADDQCGSNEVCVLDHCVMRDSACCRSYQDCDEGQLCILTGYSSDPRGNSDMLAVCQGTQGAADGVDWQESENADMTATRMTSKCHQSR